MDRRQRKSREAIFGAFTQLLSVKDFSKITVGEIIDSADVGRATFYSHFETKEYLLKEFGQELFCHIFDTDSKDRPAHRHIFDCDSSESAFIHLFQHLQKNDNNILALLSSRNNALFFDYFKNNLELLIDRNMGLLDESKKGSVPEGFWKNYIVTTLVETIRWWIEHGMKESPEVISEYFFKII